MPVTNVYSMVGSDEQGVVESDYASETDVEQSIWYTADPNLIVASDLQRINEMVPVWNSIDAIVDCGPKEWEEKRERWLNSLKAQAKFIRTRIPNEMYESSADAAKFEALGNRYVKSISVRKGLQAMVDISIMIVDLLAFCDLDLFGSEHYGGVTKCVQKIMRKSTAWHICCNLLYVTH